MPPPPPIFTQTDLNNIKTSPNFDALQSEQLRMMEEMQKVIEGYSNVFDGVQERLKDANLTSEQKDKLIDRITEKLKLNYDTINEVLTKMENTVTDSVDKMAAKIAVETDPIKSRQLITDQTRLKDSLKKLTEYRKDYANNLNSQFANYELNLKNAINQKITSDPNNLKINQIIKSNQPNIEWNAGLVKTDSNNLVKAATVKGLKAESDMNEIAKRNLNQLLSGAQNSSNGGIPGAALLAIALYSMGGSIGRALGFNPQMPLRFLSELITLPISRLLGRLNNFGEILKGYVLQLKAIFDIVIGLGKGLLAVPLRIIQYAATEGHKIKEENIKFFNNLEKFQDSFRQSSVVGQNFAGLNRQLRGRRLSYINPDNPAARLYGAKGDNLIEKQLEESAGIIKSMGPRAELMAKAVLKNVTHADSSIANYYYKAKKLMNLSEDDMGKLTNMAISLGKSFPEVFHEISSSTADVAKRFSLDFKMMSGDVLTLRKDIVNFGHKSSDELALVAGHIRQMGISMSDAMSVFSKFNTFEDAATTAAQLSQTFGMVVDSMELLKAQSPDEILQQYKDAFIASGKSFETMDRFSKSLILQQTGLSDQAAQALFSAENAGKTYEEIMADIEAKDPVKQQTRHMEEMRDAIVELKDTLSEKFTSFFDAMQEGFTQRLFENPTIRNAMEKMAKAMDNIFLKFTTMDLRKFQPLINSLTLWIDKLSNFISSGKFLNYLSKIANAIGDILTGFTTGQELLISKGLDTLIDNTRPIFEFLSKIGAEIIKNTLLAISSALPGVIDSINHTLDKLIDYISNPNKIENALSGFLSGSGDKLVKNLQSIVEKVFGANGDKGLIGRVADLFEKLFTGPTSIGKRIFGFIQNGFNNLMNDPNIKASLASMGQTIAAGIPFEKITKIITETFIDTALPEWLGGGNRSVTTPVQTDLNDAIISDKGVFKLNSQDDVMALKPGGAIENYMNNIGNMQKQGLVLTDDNLNQLKNVFIDAIASATNNSSQNRELVINLDSQKVGSVLIKGGLTTMMTNPNIAGSQPTLNTSSITTANGQIYSNAYRV